MVLKSQQLQGFLHIMAKGFGSSSCEDDTVMILICCFKNDHSKIFHCSFIPIGLLIDEGSEPEQIVCKELTCLTLTKWKLQVFWTSMINKSGDFLLFKHLPWIASQTITAQVIVCSDNIILQLQWTLNTLSSGTGRYRKWTETQHSF